MQRESVALQSTKRQSEHKGCILLEKIYRDEAIHPPWSTSHIPGLGGTIKTLPEDFEVEEIPAYEPCGHGEHLYVWLEKRDISAEYLQRLIVRKLNLAASEIGMAGLKDRHALTRQYISIPANAESRLPALEGEGIRVLRCQRHTNKLRTGHVRGNHFKIMIRDARPETSTVFNQYRDHFREVGLVNYFGPQRFGKDGETAELGWSLLQRQGKKIKSPFLRKLALSAAQSLLFNLYVIRRSADQLLHQVLAGDVMIKIPSGAKFTVEDPQREQERFNRREIVISGPIFGKSMFPARADAAEREKAILTQAELNPESFAGFGALLEGTRRALLIFIDNLTIETTAEGILVQFSLPAGCYATNLLGEIMKTKLPREDNPSLQEA